MNSDKQKSTWSSFYLVEDPPPAKSKHRHRLKFGANSVGADKDNDIVLTKSICSRRHAVIFVWETDGNGVKRVDIEDKASTFGTHINGMRHSKVQVKVNDLISFGLIYDNDELIQSAFVLKEVVEDVVAETVQPASDTDSPYATKKFVRSNDVVVVEKVPKSRTRIITRKLPTMSDISEMPPISPAVGSKSPFRRDSPSRLPIRKYHRPEVFDFKFISMKLNTLLISQHRETLLSTIKRQVANLSKTNCLATTRFYAFAYNTVFTGSEEDIRFHFYQEDPPVSVNRKKSSTREVNIEKQISKNRAKLKYDKTKPEMRIRDHFRATCIQRERGENRHVSVPLYDKCVKDFNIVAPKIQLQNSLNALVKQYCTNLYNSVQFMYKKLLQVFRYKLNTSLNNEEIEEEDVYRRRKKENAKMARMTVKYLYYDEDKEVDDGDEKLDEDYVDEALVDFVKNTMRPFDYSQNGRGIFKYAGNSNVYYRFIPPLLRLQKYVADEVRSNCDLLSPLYPKTKNRKKRLRRKERSRNNNLIQRRPPLTTFIVIPQSSYKNIHITIDSGCLHSLYTHSELQNTLHYYRNYGEFTATSHENYNPEVGMEIPEVWYQLFDLDRIDRESESRWRFGGAIVTNGEYVNIQLKRFKQSVLDAIRSDKTTVTIANKQKKSKSASTFPQSIQQSFDKGEYTDFTFIDPGKRNTVGVTTRRYVETSTGTTQIVECSFVFSSREFHHLTGMKKRMSIIRNATQPFEKEALEAWKEDYPTTNPVDLPSKKTSNYESYVLFKLANFNEGFTVYNTNKLMNLTFERRIEKQKADARLCKRILGLNENSKMERRNNGSNLDDGMFKNTLLDTGNVNRKVLITIGNGGGGSVKGYVASMGQQKLKQQLIHIAHTCHVNIDVHFGSEQYTSKQCSFDFKDLTYVRRDKKRSGLCRNCDPVTESEKAHIVYVRPHKKVVRSNMQQWAGPKERRRHKIPSHRKTITPEAIEHLRISRALREIQPNNDRRNRQSNRDSSNAPRNIGYLVLCKLRQVEINNAFKSK